MAIDTDLPPGNIVRGLKSFGHSPDLSEIDFRFEMQNGAGLTLRMDQNVLATTASSLTETAAYLQSRIPTTTGHHAIVALEMTEASAVAPAGGGTVMLRLKGINGIEYNFAVPVEVAGKLRPQLREAVQSAERQTKQTRQ
jgi:hypothetical protein